MAENLSVQSVETSPAIQIRGRRSLLAGALSGWVAMGITILLGIFITPVIIRTLGKEEYGLWGLVASLVGFYGLFDFGLSAAVARFMGNAIGANDLEQFNRVASTGKGLLGAAGMLVIVAGLVVMGPAQSLLHIPQEYAWQFRMLVILSALNIGLSLIMSVYGGAMLASEDFLAMSCLRTGAAVLRSFGGLTVVMLGGGVVGLAMSSLAVCVLEQIAAYWRCRVRVPVMRASLRGFSKGTARQVLGFASATAVAVLAEFLRSKLDVTLVTRFGGLAQAGLYSVGLSVFLYYWRSAVIVAGVVSPRLNRLHGSGDRESLRTFFQRASHLVGACICMMTGMLIGLAPLLIRLWVGEGYDESATVIRILAMGFFLDLATNPAVNSFYATGRHRYFAAQSAVEAIASFTLAYLLGARYGMYGVAAGIVIPVAVIRLTIQPWYISKVLSIRVWPYWLRCIGVATLAMSIVSAGGVALNHGWQTWGLWTSSLVMLLAYLLGALILWQFMLDSSDRAAVGGLVSSVARRVMPGRFVHRGV